MAIIGRSIVAAVVIVLVGVLGGCGSEAQADPESDIRSTVDRFTVLVSENDPACLDLITSSGKYMEYHDITADLVGRSDFCLGSRHKDFASLTISKVTVIDDSATVAFDGRSETLKLEKTGDSWLIADGGF